MGYQSLYGSGTPSANTGTDNTAIGREALYSNSSGKYNTATGDQALSSNTGGAYPAGSNNTANGKSALYSNTTGFSNTAVGYQALFANYNASGNTAVGSNALYTNYNGAVNTAIGDDALRLNYGGDYNTAVGQGALEGNDANGNTAIGYSALSENAWGDGNTAVGKSAIFRVQGDWNTAVGSNAGIAIYETYGDANTFLGAFADASSAGLTNATAIGYDAEVTASNQMRLGNSSVTTLYCYGALSSAAGGSPLSVTTAGKIGLTSSSKRYKTDIKEIEINTSKIYDLRPVSFTYIEDSLKSFGLIAEEVAEVLPDLVFYRKSSEVIKGSTSDALIPETVYYDRIPVLMLNELKKHQIIIEKQQTTIDTLQTAKSAQQSAINKLETENNDLKARLEKLEKMMMK